MSNEMISVPRDYVLRLTPVAHSTMLGMVEYCLNIRACMGMDEGFKDLDTEEEHDFVKELRALLDAPIGFSTPDCPDCACVQDGQCLCIPSKPAALHQGEPLIWVSHCLRGSQAGKFFEVPGPEWEASPGLYADPIPLYTCPAEQPATDSSTSDKYKAELYDEVWQLARDLGYGNVTDALMKLQSNKTR